MSKNLEETYELMKIEFFKQLSKMAANELTLYSAWNFYDATFDFCRLKNLLPNTKLSEEESKLQCLLPSAIKSVVNLHPGITGSIRAEELYKVLKLRSTLKFLEDDLLPYLKNDEETKENLKTLDNSHLEMLIDEWSFIDVDGPRPEGNPPDLSGVPTTHTWWTEHHRNGKHNPIDFTSNGRSYYGWC